MTAILTTKVIRGKGSLYLFRRLPTLSLRRKFSVNANVIGTFSSLHAVGRPDTTATNSFTGIHLASAGSSHQDNTYNQSITPALAGMSAHSRTACVDYYSTSSFEAALNQVLELERDSPSSNSHHQSLETCVRDFFRV
jgi:hypothetical protein